MVFLEKLEQKIKYVILILIICILLGLICSFVIVQDKIYSSSTLLIIKTQESDNYVKENNGNVELDDKMIQIFESIIKSDSTIEEVRKKVNLTLDNAYINSNVFVNKLSSSDTFEIVVKNLGNDSVVVNQELVNIFSSKISEIYSDSKVFVIDRPHAVTTANVPAILVVNLCAFVIGIVINAIIIFILVKLDEKVTSVKNVESELALKTLESIPLNTSKKKQKNNQELIAYIDEKALISKAFKRLKTNIQFLNVNNKGKNIILVTSAKPSEGKSFVSANLAISFAEVGKKVILIDTNMMNGRIGKMFGVPNNLGLSNYLSGLDSNGVEIKELINKFINESTIKNLNIVTSGTVPPNSSELLTTPKFNETIKDLSVFYDVIILDGSSILDSTDGLVLARLATSTILVTDYKKTKKDDLWKAKRDIQNIGGRLIGIIINRVKVKEFKEKNKELSSFEKIKERFNKTVKKIKEYIDAKVYERKQKLLESAKENNIEDIKIVEPVVTEKVEEAVEVAQDKQATDEVLEAKNEQINNIKEKDNKLFAFFKKEKIKNCKTDIEQVNEKIDCDKTNDILEDDSIIAKNILKSDLDNEDNLSKIEVKVESISPELKEENIKTESQKNDISENINQENNNQDNVIATNKEKVLKYLKNFKQKTINIYSVSKEKLALVGEAAKNKYLEIKEKNEENKENKKKAKEEELKEELAKARINLSKAIIKVNTLEKENEEKDAFIAQAELNKNIPENDVQVTIEEVIKNENVDNYSDDGEINKDSKDIVEEPIDNKAEENVDYRNAEIYNPDPENTTLVIIDAENGYCRAFSKNCFTEKLIRGIDNNDGFTKDHYSSNLLKRRRMGLITSYGLTQKQVERVDTLIYLTLRDYDERVWVDKKVASNKGDMYIRCITKEYEKLPEESKKEYKYRCQYLRKLELLKNQIEIEYKTDNIWRIKNELTIMDKIEIVKFAKIFSSTPKKESNNVISKMKENIKEKSNTLIKKIQVEQVKAKSVEELEKEMDELRKKKEDLGEQTFYRTIDQSDYNFVNSEYEKEELAIKEEQQRLLYEQRIEQERIKQEKREKKLQEKIRKKEEKLRKKEEIRKNKEMEKQKAKEEARIEEELLVDNLYPKTKNNKSL